MQSPEQIAKDYGGNKQKIAEAMQMGILDPTAGTLAGMFIDRMRAAAQTEQAPQQTVAQQVFAPPAPTAPGLGAPPAPPQPPMGAPAGLGATPEAAAMAPPPPQEMGAPQGEMPMMAEGGMVPPYASGGGLSDIPVPDTMFDEPSNGGFDDGYAGGGMVAFAPGGDVSPMSWTRAPITSGYGVKRSTGAHQGVDFGVGNRTPIGTPAPGKVIKAATDDINGNFVVVEHPDGTRSSYSHLSEFNVTPGQEVGAGDVIGLSGNTGRVRGKNGGHHLHFGARDAEGNRMDPTEFFKRIAPQVASGKFKNPKELTSAGQGNKTLYGMPTNLQDTIAMLTGMMPEESAEQREYSESLKEQLSPENRAQAKKDAFFEGVGKLAARLGASKSPTLLGGLAESLGAGAVDIAESLDEDKKSVREMQRELAAISNLNRKEKIEVMQMGVDLNTRAAQLAEGIETRKADIAMKNEELQVRREEFAARMYEAEQAAIAAGQKFNLDRYLIGELQAGGTRAENAKAYAGIRFGRDGEGLFGDEKKTGDGEDEFEGFSATRN